MEWPLLDAEGMEYQMEWHYPSNLAGRAIYLSVDGNEMELTLNANPSEGPMLTLDKSNLHTLSIRLAGQSNPHEDMKMEGLEIRLRKMR
jgi:hypothetical protein